MSEILLPYQLELTTASPLHISIGGEESEKNVFIFEGDKVYFIDENKLVQWIANKPDSERIADNLARSFGDRNGIKNFLQQNRINLNEVKAYSIVLRGMTSNRISCFIKNVKNEPYIPGSSLKGSLRSSLLRGLLLSDRRRKEGFERDVQNQVNYISENRPRRQSFDSIERKFFVAKTNVEQRKFSNYDLNRSLMIRDSAPFSISSLHLATVKVLSVKNAQGNASLAPLEYKLIPRSNNEMKIAVEAIGENAKTVCSLVWQTHLLDGLYGAKELNFEAIKDWMLFLPEYCRLASAHILKQEIDFYKRHGHRILEQWFAAKYNELLEKPAGTFLLPLGWGSGYDAKTVSDLFSENVFHEIVNHCDNTKRLGKPSGRNIWLGLKDSPKSRKVVVYNNNDIKPLGWIWVTLKPLQGGEDWFIKERRGKQASAPKIELSAVDSSPQRSPSPQKDAQASSQPPLPPPQIKERPAERKTILSEFKSLPKVGDVFYGEVFDSDGYNIFVELKGLDPNEIYGRITSENNLSKVRPRDGAKIVCEVIEIKKSDRETIVECKTGT